MKKDNIITLAIVIFLLVGLYLSMKITSDLNALRERVDRNNYEYQIVIEDNNTIIVFDKERHVGTVKLEGALDSLLTADNL
jgi:hypothetical protein